MISDAEFKAKNSERRLSYRKGVFGNLLEKDFGASLPVGECKLYIEDVFIDAFQFKSRKDRQLLFGFWNKRYRLNEKRNYYIDVSYTSFNNNKYERRRNH